jgi:hypothetical protein
MVEIGRIICGQKFNSVINDDKGSRSIKTNTWRRQTESLNNNGRIKDSSWLPGDILPDFTHPQPFSFYDKQESSLILHR